MTICVARQQRGLKKMAERAEPCVERCKRRKVACQIYIGTEFCGHKGVKIPNGYIKK